MTANLLPPAKVTFVDLNGVPLADGSVTFYVPGTTTPKDTWQDSAQTILNTNPIALDARGQAVIWGSGSYRQVVMDALGNTIWDQITVTLDESLFAKGPNAATAGHVALFGDITGKTLVDGGQPLISITASGGGDQSTALNASLTTAFTDGVPVIWPAGSYRANSNLTNLFNVANFGRGTITDGTSVFSPDCHEGATNTLHVRPDVGSDANDGISSGRALLTVNEALSRIDKLGVGQCAWVIQVYACTPAQSAASEPITISVNSDAFRRLTIQGIAPTTTTFLGVSAQAGVDGAYDLTLIVGSTAGMVVGNYLGVQVATGPTYYETWQVGGRILAVIDGTHVKVRSTAWYGAPPVAAGTGTVFIAQTHLAFTGVTGIYSAGCTMKDLALVGSLTVGTFGLLAGNPFGIQNGETYVDGCFWTVDFGDDGARCDGAELVFLSTCRHWSHNNGDNGKQARGSGNQRNFGWYAGVGNGWQQIPLSAGNGTMAQQSGAAYEFNCYVAGNWGMGSIGRTGGNVIHDNGGIVRACRNDNDYKAGPGGGSVQALNGVSRGSHDAGYHVEGFGTLLVSSSSSTDSGGNGYENFGGYLYMVSAVITNSANNGVVSNGSGARTLAGLSNVVSVGGGHTPYFASQGGWIDRTGAVGLTTSSADGSGVNTLGSLGSLIIA